MQPSVIVGGGEGNLKHCCSGKREGLSSHWWVLATPPLKKRHEEELE